MFGSDFMCPYCGAGHKEYDFDFCEEGSYSVECANCGRSFDVDVSYTTLISVDVPTELESCSGRCWAWSIGCCHYGEKFMLSDGHVTCNVPDCPLGHPMESE